jgi:fructose/tagatose bisphosphate aldolase
MQTLVSTLQDDDHRRVAIGHFNVSELVTFKAVSQAAQERGVPVIVWKPVGD